MRLRTRRVSIATMNLSLEHRRLLLDTARAVIRSALSARRLELPDDCDPQLTVPAGCFVSLHDRLTHRLRGCVGRLVSESPLLDTLQHTAAGVLEDPRFVDRPVTLAELPRLELEVSVLSPLEPARDPLDFDPPVHGIYLVFGQRTGCFLPQVARETGWTHQQLLDRLCTEKLGMSPLTWQNPSARLFRFTVTLIGPEPFDGWLSGVEPQQPGRDAVET